MTTQPTPQYPHRHRLYGGRNTHPPPHTQETTVDALRAEALQHLEAAATHTPGSAEERYHSYTAGTLASLFAADANRHHADAITNAAEIQAGMIDVAKRMLDQPQPQPQPETEGDISGAYPPVADKLAAGTLESAVAGAAMLDANVDTPYGRNVLAHALVRLQRDGWLRDAPEWFDVASRPSGDR